MTPGTDLAALVAAVSDEQVPALLALVAARLAQAKAPAAHGPPPEDRLVTIDEAAERLGTSKDWLRRHKALPFRVEVSPGQVRYSVAGLERFIARRLGK
ncbi:MAG: helix-turn-helix domain-containing protein [Candidatus Binatia bacterium]